MAPLSDRDYRALANFRHALRRFEAFSERAARDAGLTPAQHQLLLAVRGCGPADPTTSVVAEMLQVKLHSATELIARAEQNGLIVRTVDPSDARRALVHLTPAGEHRLEELSRTHRAELRRFRREMSDLLDSLDEDLRA